MNRNQYRFFSDLNRISCPSLVTIRVFGNTPQTFDHVMYGLGDPIMLQVGRVMLFPVLAQMGPLFNLSRGRKYTPIWK